MVKLDARLRLVLWGTAIYWLLVLIKFIALLMAVLEFNTTESPLQKSRGVEAVT